jgi:predicted TIM-barrel fold metal-dependent hydrolase
MKHVVLVFFALVLITACAPVPTANPAAPTAPSTEPLLAVTATTVHAATSTATAIPTAISTVTSAPTAVPVPTYTPTLPRPLIPMIDAESEVDDTVNLDKVMRLMEQGKISCTILSTIYDRDTADVVSLAAKNPGRIIPAVRLKNRTLDMVKKQIDSGQYAAMQESLMYHAQKGGGRSPLVVVYPDNPHVQEELNYAISKNWPFIVHIEFRAAGSERDKFMTGLEALLNRNPKHPFVLIHLGQLEVADVKRLIQTHSNIYFMTSSADPVFANYGGTIWTNMFDGDHLAPGWKELLVSYPDRFILAFDRVYPEMWGQMYLDQIALWRKTLDELPLEGAHAFAHGNAERLWHLTLSNQDPVPTCSINSK